ncbi:hypothetical protein SAMN06272755_1230 [Picosynechococcus sp. OG1]|nr:hypothetical protein SAMN06272755_1230 [Picosynechococcus sp. OG1]SMQ78619.1 hypothetical protein SAMN06272774_0511 [Synechococcus sp. 7002]
MMSSEICFETKINGFYAASLPPYLLSKLF